MVKPRKSSRLLGAAYLAMDSAISSSLRSKRPHILVACMPKSGSTFFSAALSEYPGFHNISLVPDYEHREQELCQMQLSRYNHRSYIAQLHIRNSAWTQHLISQYGITPVVLVRNLADAVISLRDHIRKDPQGMPMVFITEDHRHMNNADLEAAIVRLAMPWYLNFYVGWKTDPSALVLHYDDMTADPASAMTRVFEQAKVKVIRRHVDQALERVKHKQVRFNVGISGRGGSLAPQAAQALLDLLDSYPSLQADTLFVQTRQTLASHEDTIKRALR